MSHARRFRPACGVVLMVSAIAAGLAGCWRDPAPEAGRPATAVAQVGGAWLLQADVDYYLQAGLAADPATALQRMIDEELMAQAAQRSALVAQPDYRAARRRLAATRWLEQQEATPAAPTEEILRAQWQAAPERFQQPARRRIAVIRRQFTTAAEREAAIATLERARTEFRDLAPPATLRGFGPLAAHYSDEPDTRFQGGLSGWIAADQGHLLVPDAVRTALLQRPADQLTAPHIEFSEHAAWLCLILETEPARWKPFAEVRPLLAAEYAQRAAQDRREQLLAQLTRATPVQIFTSPQTSGAPPRNPTPPDPFPRK